MIVPKSNGDVLDVAAILLDRCGPLETMKLQKLVYYAQAWHLALLHVPLFEQEEEAWAYGPVVSNLYDQHRGRMIIRSIDTGARRINTGFAPVSITCIERIAAYYGPMTGAELSRLTHQEDPWRDARKTGVAQQIIPKEAMWQYYAKQLRFFHTSILTSHSICPRCSVHDDTGSK